MCDLLFYKFSNKNLKGFSFQYLHSSTLWNASILVPVHSNKISNSQLISHYCIYICTVSIRQTPAKERCCVQCCRVHRCYHTSQVLWGKLSVPQEKRDAGKSGESLGVCIVVDLK